MALKNNHWSRSPAPPAALLPPNWKDFGPVEFTAADRSSLDIWLSEDGWPRGKMDVVALEGYLTAMIVWPVEVSPGAWLPAIWGIRGWKVAEKISTPLLYERFNRLVIGYRRYLASLLNTDPRHFVPCLHSAGGAANGAMRWSLGFLQALQHGSHGFNWRSTEVTAAVHIIAEHAQAPEPLGAKSQDEIAAELGGAIFAIVADVPVGRRLSSAKPLHAVLLQ